jgi:hypothetical protein
VTPHFNLHEFVHSLTAIQLKIDNTPPLTAQRKLVRTAVGMEGIRKKLNDKPIRITSGYRSPELNQAIGGSKKSQHLTGEACDFVCPAFGTPKEVVEHLSRFVGELGIDQMIAEGSWIHVSFTERPRHEVLSFVGGKFVKGIV